MRALSLPVAALAATLLLSACGSGGGGEKKPDDKADAGCVADLAVQFGPANAAPAAGDTGNVPVTVTNRGDAKCTLKGLPSLELIAGGAATTVAPAEAAGAGATTLVQEASTSFTLTYVRGETGGDKSLPVQNAKVLLPGAAEAKTFKWSYGDVALKSDGRTPDASLSGFQRSGD
ncbi:hypothetical protein SZN_34277 [Streptomyces zinciresistens K42]|uniref:DUF4232 domain-containing protein n=1 Tax=Streptomyces zinciresistens K42 TaxID=700597 RepID=G2GMV0_9ACTN|nr:DUF4232 domain-containing protein [Streptomyces zinciresistens]EGX55158.1 hypothetical protein SZN_34277 [Streptomyces zinciresistens K42]